MHPQYQKALVLRLQGKSYNEIAKELSVAKSSVSQWCKNLKLPRVIQKIIESRTQAAHDQLLACNQRKHKFVQAENKRIREEAIKQISSLSRQGLLLVGTALFWGEGYKKAEQLRSPYVCFSNSDHDMVRLFMRFIREVIQAPENRIRVSIHIYPSIDEKKAINYWAKVTNLPQERFCIKRQISRASKRKRPCNSLPYGTLDLRVNSRQNFYQIRGWIDGLIRQKG